MGNDRRLRHKVRQLLQAGLLPRGAPDSIRGGLGTGARCVVCEGTVAATDIELEVRFGDGSLAGTHKAHLRCFSIFEDERQNRSSERMPARLPAAAADRGQQ